MRSKHQSTNGIAAALLVAAAVIFGAAPTAAMRGRALHEPHTTRAAAVTGGRVRPAPTPFEQGAAGEVPGPRPDPVDSPANYEYSGCAATKSQPRDKKMSQHSNAYRYYYYYGSLSARRDGAAMGCPGVTMN